MCYHYNPAKLAQLKKRYPDKYSDYEDARMPANGFTHPNLPVIKSDDATIMKWGLIPHWVRDNDAASKLAKMCLNAKIETLANKPSFRDALKKKQRCIIPANSFYEWRWEDEKRKQKTKYKIEHLDTDIFYFGGLYSQWNNSENGRLIETYTIITCTANAVMEGIHNIKKRMPTILNDNEEAELWLEGKMNLEDLRQVSMAQNIEGNIEEK